MIDFENIAAGTEKEGLGRFDVDALMKRLKDKGRILVARSYADWGRFARFKQTLLSANVTMMELTSHGMQDKNRADIAMVVDCLELAFTRNYIDTFVVVSGDSDFTPLVLKMRELNKRVIGIGTRASTSRLLIQACDEFMFYDTIVKEARQPRMVAEHHRPGTEPTTEQIFDVLVDALAGLQRENPEPALASVVKTAVLRKSPDFNEVDLGFGSFARFLEQAQDAGYITLSRDNKSGGYRVDSAEDGEAGEGDRRPAGGESKARAEATSWRDPYLPEGSDAVVGTLAAKGLNPLAFPTRMAILQLLEQIVAERKKKRRRITIPFVQDDLRKRLKKSHPDLPNAALQAVFDALSGAGLFIHRDGRPIRSNTAPFVLGKSAEQLNRALIDLYLRELKQNGVDLGDGAALADLFLGHRDRKREIEEAVAWMGTGGGDDRDDDSSEEADSADLDIDDILLTEDGADEPVPEPAIEADLPPEPEPEAPVADEVDLDAALVASEPVASDEAPAEEAKVPRRRRTRTRRKKTGEADAAAIDDLDAVLDVDSGDTSV